MAKRSKWKKVTITVAIHDDIDADVFIKHLQKFISLEKKMSDTFVSLGSHVTDLAPQELLQVTMSVKRG